jgi:hypothetical protein
MDCAPSSARAGTPHPPFLENKKQFKPLPKMRRIFHSGVLRETGFAERERDGISGARARAARRAGWQTW